MSRKKIVAVDFDGVLHAYRNGWGDGSISDEPVEGAVTALKKLITRGYDIVVFTAREDLEAVKEWLDRYGFPMNAIKDVTNKKPAAHCYIDDRAIRFTNWKDMLNYL